MKLLKRGKISPQKSSSQTWIPSPKNIDEGFDQKSDLMKAVTNTGAGVQMWNHPALP